MRCPSEAQNQLQSIWAKWILMTHLHSRCVDIKLPEDCKSLFKELVADGDVSYIRGIIVVQSVDVLHYASAISFDGRQDQKVLQVPEQQQGKY